ncbi:MAG: B12-binding domain-containing radical SAM protein [Candidatus Rifleibacteriota bacterium]
MSGSLELLLVAPPLIWSEKRAEMKQPLNLLYLASWLNEKGLSAQIIDAAFVGWSIDQVLNRIKEKRPRFVGLPFYQATIATALQLCRAIRSDFPDIWLVAGGPAATTSAEILLQQDTIDFCVVGEGEKTLEELLRASLGRRATEKRCSELFSIKGLAFREGNGPVFTGNREPIGSLDILPFLDFDLIDIKGYFAYHSSIDMSDWLFLTTSRGCHARCSYCATPVLWPDGLRRQSAARVLAEIEWQRQRYPTAQIGFMDDSFFSDKAWLKKFCQGVKTMDVKYCCIGRADHLTENDVKLLAESGCIYVAFGIETGSSDRQKKILKFLDLDRVRNTVCLLKKFEICAKGFFMLGFPDETPEEILQTINFAVELKALGMEEFNFFPVSIYPGTELAKQFSPDHCVSTIYQADGAEKKDHDSAEAKLLRYANIPDADINRSFNSAQILRLVKLAYKKLEESKMTDLSEIFTAAGSAD